VEILEVPTVFAVERKGLFASYCIGQQVPAGKLQLACKPDSFFSKKRIH
jgi:hypothetical protein